MSSEPYTVHIYAGEAGLISKWTLQYYNIETGGDLFGLWLSESEVVIQAVLGPGQNCRRTTTSFFQDEQYLGAVGSLLTNNQGLCNVGSWHSHHTMNIPDPSRDDRNTVWRHLPTSGRFLLLIATIDMKTGSPEVQIGFNLFESTIINEQVSRMKLQFLEGESPIRANKALRRKMLEGSEVNSKSTPYPEPSVQSNPFKRRAVKPKVPGPEVNSKKYGKRDVRGNAGYDNFSDFFQDQTSGHRGHQESSNQNVTCDEGVLSSSLRNYNTYIINCCDCCCTCTIL